MDLSVEARFLEILAGAATEDLGDEIEESEAAEGLLATGEIANGEVAAEVANDALVETASATADGENLSEAKPS